MSSSLLPIYLFNCYRLLFLLTRIIAPCRDHLFLPLSSHLNPPLPSAPYLRDSASTFVLTTVTDPRSRRLFALAVPPHLHRTPAFYTWLCGICIAPGGEILHNKVLWLVATVTGCCSVTPLTNITACSLTYQIYLNNIFHRDNRSFYGHGECTFQVVGPPPRIIPAVVLHCGLLILHDADLLPQRSQCLSSSSSCTHCVPN